MLVDRTIYDSDNRLIWDEDDDDEFPEEDRIPFVGALDECLIPSEEEPLPSRNLHFFNGGVDLDCNPAAGCCFRVGDANGTGGDEPTIGDIAAIVDALFITRDCEVISFAEADVNQSGGIAPTCDDITIGDVAELINYLFIATPAFGELPDCL